MRTRATALHRLLVAFLLLGLLLVLPAFPSATALPLSGANADMNKVCTKSVGLYSDRTASANDVLVNDVPLGNDALGTQVSDVYFGMNEPFASLFIDVGTAGVAGTVSWTYWNGTAWAALAVTDDTNNFRTAGVNDVTFTAPSDWAESQIDGATCTGTRYNVKASTAVAYTTVPKADQISAIEYNVRVKVRNELLDPIGGLGASSFLVFGGTTNTVYAFRENGTGIYEMALDAAAVDVTYAIAALPNGYVQAADQSITASTTMSEAGSWFTVKFAVKVTPDDEITGITSLTTATVAAGNGFATTCVQPAVPTGTFYCPVPVADTNTDVRIALDGYVTKTVSSAYTDRVTHMDPQRVAPLRVTRAGAYLPQAMTDSAAIWDGTNYYLFGGSPRTDLIVRYNPVTGINTTMNARLPSARSGVSAIWNGTYAYIFGGAVEVGTTNQILRYDPATDTITVMTATLPTARDRTAAVWSGTYAYIFGGWDTGTSDDVLRYNPATDTLSTMNGALTTARNGVGAVWDGVDAAYIFGGWNLAPLNQILKYNATTDSVSLLTTLLPVPLESMGAVWNGTHAILLGGWEGVAKSDDIVAFRASDASISTLTAKLPSARDHITAAWNGTHAYVFGGSDATGTLSEIVRFSPSENAVDSLSLVLPTARAHAGTAWTGTYGYIFGGKDASTRYNTIIRFDPATLSTRVMNGVLPSARAYPGAAWNGNDAAFLFGGYADTGGLNQIARYTPANDTVTVMNAVLPTARDGTSVIWDGSRFYIFGGSQTIGLATSYYDDIVRYDPVNDTATLLAASLPSGRMDTSAIWDGTYAYIFGGYNNSAINQIIRFNPATQEVLVLNETLPRAEDWMSAVWTGTYVYLLGGDGSPDIWRFDPATQDIVDMDTINPQDVLPGIRAAPAAFWSGGKA